MKNPWVQLPPEPPYVLADDERFVDAFNENTKTRSRSDRYVLHTCLRPVPYCGKWKAPLVVLGLNPFRSEKAEGMTETVDRLAAVVASLKDETGEEQNYSLTPPFLGSPGQDWWVRCLRHLDVPLACLANSVLAVDFHGYFSKNFSPIPRTLPSQNFGFWLVEDAIERGAVIVLTRGARQWLVAVPRLAGYEKLVRLGNPQSAVIGEKNCVPESGFALIREAAAAA